MRQRQTCPMLVNENTVLKEQLKELVNETNTLKGQKKEINVQIIKCKEGKFFSIIFYIPPN